MHTPDLIIKKVYNILSIFMQFQSQKMSILDVFKLLSLLKGIAELEYRILQDWV